MTLQQAEEIRGSQGSMWYSILYNARTVQRPPPPPPPLQAEEIRGAQGSMWYSPPPPPPPLQAEEIRGAQGSMWYSILYNARTVQRPPPPPPLQAEEIRGAQGSKFCSSICYITLQSHYRAQTTQLVDLGYKPAAHTGRRLVLCSMLVMNHPPSRRC